MSDLLDALQVAELLRVSRSTVYTLAREGRIPHKRVGAQLRFSRTRLMTWLEGPEAEPRPAVAEVPRGDQRPPPIPPASWTRRSA